jgi:plastocyanin
MVALILVSLITLGIYAYWDPGRASTAEEEFEEKSIERAARVFAQNCRLCHGNVGEGGALGGRLAAAPALNRPSLQGFVDATKLAADVGRSATSIRVDDASKLKAGQVILVNEERMEVVSISGTTLTVKRGVGHTKAGEHFSGDSVLGLSDDALRQQRELVTNTIVCGRVGTFMPSWAQSQGGPLSDEQIRQLTVLITTGRWSIVEEEVNREDIIGPLAESLDPDSVVLRARDVTLFVQGDYIRIGEERLRLVSVPKVEPAAKDKSGFIILERGVLGTTPLDHVEGTPVYRFPTAPEPSVLQASCGQTARAPAPTGTPSLIEPFEGQTVEVVARNILFNVSTITVRAGGQVRVRLDNQDTGVDHNVAFYRGQTDLTPVSPGSIGLVFTGPGVDDTAFDIPAAGTYFFRCDVHPTTMTGTFKVQP